jgi:hypothetical protein
MLDKNIDFLLLGAEARPCDLAEINRVNEEWRDSEARTQRTPYAAQPLGLVAIAMRWLNG